MNIMYEYQHKVLPKWIYSSPEFFSDLITYGEKKVLFASCKKFFEDNLVEFPYQENDFGGFRIRVDADTVMVMLRFPQPEAVPLCYRMYMYVDTNSNRIACYTVERGMDPYNNCTLYFLCGWDENGVHRNYGSHDIEEMAVASIREMRFFYAQFHGLKDVLIPDFMPADTEGVRQIECPNCEVLMTYDMRMTKQGDRILLQCPKCMRIFHVRLDEDGFAILNNVIE